VRQVSVLSKQPASGKPGLRMKMNDTNLIGELGLDARLFGVIGAGNG
jgi:hypothetical protein